MNQIQIFKNYLAYAKLDVKQHQIEGVEWLLNKELNNKKGGICADEMGLGKTIQMIGLIVANQKANTLVILPVSLLSQWESQIEKTLGFKPLVYYGKEKYDIDMELLNHSPITLTTYGQLLSDHCTLFDKRWNRIIYDEAHHLKNKSTRLWNIQSKLIRDYTWLVTGTPIQNRKSDIKSLFSLIGLRDVGQNWEQYIDEYILKRTKQECDIQLPNVIKNNICVPFEKDIENQTQVEKEISRELHSGLSFMNINLENSDRLISNYMSTVERLALIIQCRQMCIFPKLLKMRLDVTKSICDLDDDDCFMFGEAVTSSSKLNKVCEDLRSNRNGRSKLVFCNYKSEIDYLYRECLTMGYKTAKIDGRTSNSNRKKILEGSYDVLILQIYTCSEGINLQKYSEIYITSPNWNPAIEDQAIGRCHRIGQKQEVSVYRYVMENFDEEGKERSLDNHIEKLQELKRKIYI